MTTGLRCTACGSTDAVHPYLDRPKCERCRPLIVAPPPDPAVVARARVTAQPLAIAALERAGDNYVKPGQRVTSYTAARKALPRSGTQRRLVLDALYDAHVRGTVGATDVQLAKHLDMSGNSVRPRRGELVDLWLVEDSGVTRQHDGSPHIVWRVTNAALAALHHKPD